MGWTEYHHTHVHLVLLLMDVDTHTQMLLASGKLCMHLPSDGCDLQPSEGD